MRCSTKIPKHSKFLVSQTYLESFSTKFMIQNPKSGTPRELDAFSPIFSRGN